MMKKIFTVALVATLLGANVHAAVKNIVKWSDIKSILMNNQGRPLTVHNFVLVSRTPGLKVQKTYDLTRAVQASAALGNLDLAVSGNSVFLKQIFTSGEISFPLEQVCSMNLEFTAQGQRYAFNSGSTNAFLIDTRNDTGSLAQAPYYQKIQMLSDEELGNLLNNSASKPIRVVVAQWYGSTSSGQNTMGQLPRSFWHNVTNETQLQVNNGTWRGVTLSGNSADHILSIQVIFILDNRVYQCTLGSDTKVLRPELFRK